MAIQIRRGTSAQWETSKSNIVAGEPAVTTDTGRFFVGTGNGEFVELQKKGDGNALTDDVKQALLQLAEKVAYIDEHGQTYYNDLESALYPPSPLASISAVYTQGGTVYDTDSLDSLKSDLVVTAVYEDSSQAVVTTYTLSGTLTAGTSTITVSYGGKTTTFNVTVTHINYSALKGYGIGPSSGNINVSINKNNNRATIICDTGNHAYPKQTSAAALIGDYYPIPIPSGASSMIITMPSALYVGVRTFIWDSAQNYYNNTSGLSSAWTANNASTFDVSSYNDGTWFAGFTFKVGTAGTTDMQNYDMSGVSISFE